MLLEKDPYPGGGDPVAEYRLGDVRFHAPCGPVGVPVRIVGVALAERAIKRPGEAADRCFVADIRGAEPAGRHAAEVTPKLQEDDVETHAARLHRRGDLGGSPPVNAQVGSNLIRRVGGRLRCVVG